MTIRVILVGGGGHCSAVMDVIELTGAFTMIGIVDLPGPAGRTLNGLPVVGEDNDLPALCRRTDAFVLTIGQTRSADARVRLGTVLIGLDARLPSIVSPRAHVSTRATLADGTVVMHGAVVNADANIGRFGIVNTGSIVEHDVTVGEYSHVSTGAVVNGGVQIGSGSFIGSNAVVREGVRIGSGVVVAAGAIVVRDVDDGKLVKGLHG